MSSGAGRLTGEPRGLTQKCYCKDNTPPQPDTGRMVFSFFLFLLVEIPSLPAPLTLAGRRRQALLILSPDPSVLYPNNETFWWINKANTYNCILIYTVEGIYSESLYGENFVTDKNLKLYQE